MLVTAGVSDPRVTYWEPAKWVARLRATKTDDNALLLRTNMTSGHFGKTGRFAALEDAARTYAFALKCVGQALDKACVRIEGRNAMRSRRPFARGKSGSRPLGE